METPVIRISNLCMSYGEQDVLRDISLDILPGRIYTLIGPNGSGKSTLIKCILGLVVPRGGTIFVNGMPVGKTWEYRRQIGYMPQIAHFPQNMKVRELISMIRDIRGPAAREAEMISLLRLEAVQHKSLKSLSGGTRQKVNALLALMFDSPVYIFDEATVGLDPVSRLHFKQQLLRERKAGKTILIVSHFIHEVEALTDELIFILDGKIYFSGSLDSLKAMRPGYKLEEVIASILDPGSIPAES